VLSISTTVPVSPRQSNLRLYEEPLRTQLALPQLATAVKELQRNLQRKFQRPGTNRVTSESEKINDVQRKIVLAPL